MTALRVTKLVENTGLRALQTSGKTLLAGVCVLLTMLPLSLPAVAAALPATDPLHLALAQQDAEFFQRGFNQCELAYLEKTVSNQLRFYHDQGGVQDKTLFLQNTKRYICGDMEHKPIRQLTPGSLSTFPLYQNGVLYGAIQHGQHQFYLREAGQPDRLTGTARFSSVWLLVKPAAGKAPVQWQLSDVHSYDHQPAPAPEAAAASTAAGTAKSIPNNNSQADTADTSQTVPDAQALQALLKQHQVPALGLGIIKDGALQSVQVIGELQAGRPAPAETIFKVASLTKPVVALLTLRLVAAGKLGLDEPLAPYWVDPDVKADPRHLLLTPRLVLTHQTGFANWRYLDSSNQLKFLFKPGSQHSYSGEGFEYLRRALEHKFATPLAQLAADYVFKPAGMTDTHFYWDERVDERRYARNHDAKGQLLALEKYQQANAAANLLTTTADYSRFLLFVLAQQQAMPELYQQLITPQVALGPQHGFGLGFEIYTGFSAGESMLLHTGKDPGVSALAALMPASRQGYVLLMNGDNSLPVLEHLLPQLYLGAELWQRK